MKLWDEVEAWGAYGGVIRLGVPVDHARVVEADPGPVPVPNGPDVPASKHADTLEDGQGTVTQTLHKDV